MKKIIAIIFTLSLLNSCANITDADNFKEQLLKFKDSKTHNEFIKK
tara:strand:- start:595 stop:732 length:138 start_codon:yes stop_codon:yes gene_type:complete